MYTKFGDCICHISEDIAHNRFHGAPILFFKMAATTDLRFLGSTSKIHCMGL